MKVPVFLPVSMLTMKTTMVLSPAGDILGAAVSVSVWIFPGHRHMIGFLVIHQENARYGFPPRRMRRDGKSTCPNNIRSLPSRRHNHCQVLCHKEGSSKQYSRMLRLSFLSMCCKSLRVLSLITLLVVTSPCELLMNHNSETLLKRSPMVATNLHQHVQSSGEQWNSSTLPSPCSAISYAASTFVFLSQWMGGLIAT